MEPADTCFAGIHSTSFLLAETQAEHGITDLNTRYLSARGGKLESINLRYELIGNTKIGGRPAQEKLAKACFAKETSSAKNSADLLESAAFSLINLPIFRAVHSEGDFLISTAEEMAAAQKRNAELVIVRQWIESKVQPNADKLASLSPRMKCFADNIDDNFISTKDVLMRSSIKEPQQTVTIVPASLIE